jgi:E3 ubiquitin-protein ligase BIG BROTHER-like protein
MLQAQEQAWLAMAGASSGVIENLPPAGSGEAGPAGSAGQSREGGSSSGGGGSGEDGEAEGDEEEGEEQQEKELTDEEVARRMQEEEEREFQQRLLALAGVGPGGAAATGSGGAAGGAGGGGGGLARDLAGELAEAAGEYLSEDDVDPDDMTYEEVGVQGQARGGEGSRQLIVCWWGRPSACVCWGKN